MSFDYQNNTVEWQLLVDEAISLPSEVLERRVAHYDTIRSYPIGIRLLLQYSEEEFGVTHSGHYAAAEKVLMDRYNARQVTSLT